MEKDADIPARRPRATAVVHALRAAALLPCLTVLAACQGQQDLSASGCLPLRAPAQVVLVQVVLVQEAGLYTVRDFRALVLSAHPRDSVNDGFHGTQRLRTLAPGTPLNIERLQQAWGFDVGKGRISAFGTLAGGERYEYGWGGGTTIGRAPWEPAAVPRLRTVSCGD